MPRVELVTGEQAFDRPVLVAVGATPDADAVVAAAAQIGRGLGAPLDIVHVRETVVIEELAIDPEDAGTAEAAVRRHVNRLAAHGIHADGHVLHSIGDHAAAGLALAEHARAVGARTIVVGRSPHGALVQFSEGSLTTTLRREAPCRVVYVTPDQQPRELTPEALVELRQAS
jgi:K+-sensing histidine kinase KdpD